MLSTSHPQVPCYLLSESCPGLLCSTCVFMMNMLATCLFWLLPWTLCFITTFSLPSSPWDRKFCLVCLAIGLIISLLTTRNNWEACFIQNWYRRWFNNPDNASSWIVTRLLEKEASIWIQSIQELPTWTFCLHVCMLTACLHSVCWSQKRILNPLELAFQAIMSLWVAPSSGIAWWVNLSSLHKLVSMQVCIDTNNQILIYIFLLKLTLLYLAIRLILAYIISSFSIFSTKNLNGTNLYKLARIFH